MKYTSEQLAWIDAEMEKIGVTEYRFCIENNKYVCDKFGNIYSVMSKHFYYCACRIKKLTLFCAPSGYLITTFYDNGKGKHFFAHRVIANAWLGKHPDLTVNHINGIRTDNRLVNLEFCTQAENNKHCARMKSQGKRLPKKLCAYLLSRYYNLSLNDIQKIISSNTRDIKNWIYENDAIFSVIEFTDEQIEKIFAYSENKGIFSNKELLKEYLKRGREE